MFIFEYLVDLNATGAAKRAGYSRKSARFQGARLLTNANILREISAIQQRRFQRLGVTPEWVLSEIAFIAFANMLDYIRIEPDGSPSVDLSRLSRENASALSEISTDEVIERRPAGRRGSSVRIRRTTLRLRQKLAALEDLARHMRLFTEAADASFCIVP